MSVDDWARREAADQWPEEEHEGRTRSVFAHGITHAFSALLSDEAVEAAARSLHDGYAPLSGSLQPNSGWEKQARAALQAAIDAVTKEAHND